jgi:hypothetical protein
MIYGSVVGYQPTDKKTPTEIVIEALNPPSQMNISSEELLNELSHAVDRNMKHWECTHVPEALHSLKQDIHELSLENLSDLQDRKIELRKVYAHIHLDKYISRNSLLEGLKPGTAMLAMMSGIKSCLNREDLSPELMSKLKTLYNSFSLSNYIAQMNRKLNRQHESELLAKEDVINSLSTEDYEEFKRRQGRVFLSTNFVAQEIAIHIKLLEIEEYCLIPGGFSSAKAAHAMLYEVFRESQDGYRFTVYNTADGVEAFHFTSVKADSRSKGKQAPTTLEYRGLTLNQVTNLSFLKRLIELRVRPRSGHCADHIYQLLGNHFKVDGSPGALRTTKQRSGTCSWKCLNVFLRNHLSPLEYRLLKYYISGYATANFALKLNLANSEIKQLLDDGMKRYQGAILSRWHWRYVAGRVLHEEHSIPASAASFVNDHIAKHQDLILLSLGVKKLYERYKKYEKALDAEIKHLQQFRVSFTQILFT